MSKYFFIYYCNYQIICQILYNSFSTVSTKMFKIQILPSLIIEELPKTKEDGEETLDEVETLDTNEEIENKADSIEESTPNPDLEKTEILDTIVEEPKEETLDESPAPLIAEEQNDQSTFEG